LANFEGQQEVRHVDQVVAAPTRGIEITLPEFMKLKQPNFSGCSANEDPQLFITRLERLWRSLACSKDSRIFSEDLFQVKS